MAAINFPGSSSSPWTSPSGVVYTFSNGKWSAAPGGGGLSVAEQLETPQSITADKNYTGSTNYGLMGPVITVASNATVTVGSTSVLTII